VRRVHGLVAQIEQAGLNLGGKFAAHAEIVAHGALHAGFFVGASDGLWSRAQLHIRPAVRKHRVKLCSGSKHRSALTKTLSDAPPRAPECNRDATGAFAGVRVRLPIHVPSILLKWVCANPNDPHLVIGQETPLAPRVNVVGGVCRLRRVSFCNLDDGKSSGRVEGVNLAHPPQMVISALKIISRDNQPLLPAA
jgi:hypothetical protein